MSDQSTLRPLFWLHIKKNAGGTIRRLLGPHYVQTERMRRPVNFIQSDPAAWNDILNNFRIPLGEYQFRRCLFARRYLYSDSWDGRIRFAFARNPVDRAVSAFFYLREPRGENLSFVQYLLLQGHPVPADDGTLFDRFLGLVAETRNSDTFYRPVDLHFAAHTAAMWDDVADDNGQVLLNHIFRVDDLHRGLACVFELSGRARPRMDPSLRVNSRPQHMSYQPSRSQLSRIEALYPRDFDLYEGASPA